MRDYQQERILEIIQDFEKLEKSLRDLESYRNFAKQKIKKIKLVLISDEET